MEKIERPEKVTGRDTVSSSYQLWEFRLEKGGTKAWADRINDAPKEKKGDY